MNDNQPFPVQGGTKLNPDGSVARPIQRYDPTTIPWWLAEEAYDGCFTAKGQARFNQAVEELERRLTRVGWLEVADGSSA